MKNVLDKSCRENWNTYFFFDNFCWKSCCNEIMSQNIVEWGRPQMATWCMHIASWIP